MIINIFLLLILFVIVTLILFSSKYVYGVILVNLLSVVVAVLYLVMNAPDVAITEAAIGACISTIFFLWSILALKKRNCESRELDCKVFSRRNVIALVLILILASLFSFIFSDLPIYGDKDAPINNHVYDFYIDATKSYFSFPNTVASILAGFRGYDTLWETVVIFTAGIAVSIVLRD